MCKEYSSVKGCCWAGSAAFPLFPISLDILTAWLLHADLARGTSAKLSEKLSRAIKMELVAFDPASSPVSAIDFNSGGACRLFSLCRCWSVTLNLTSNLCCLKKKKKKLTSLNKGVWWTGLLVCVTLSEWHHNRVGMPRSKQRSLSKRRLNVSVDLVSVWISTACSPAC